MTEHLFTFKDGPICYSFAIAPDYYAKLPKKKRQDYLSSLREELLTCLPNVRKASRTHFCRFGAQVIEFATGKALAKTESDLGFEIPSGFD